MRRRLARRGVLVDGCGGWASQRMRVGRCRVLPTIKRCHRAALRLGRHQAQRAMEKQARARRRTLRALQGHGVQCAGRRLPRREGESSSRCPLSRHKQLGGDACVTTVRVRLLCTLVEPRGYSLTLPCTPALPLLLRTALPAGRGRRWPAPALSPCWRQRQGRLPELCGRQVPGGSGCGLVAGAWCVHSFGGPGWWREPPYPRHRPQPRPRPRPNARHRTWPRPTHTHTGMCARIPSPCPPHPPPR